MVSNSDKGASCGNVSAVSVRAAITGASCRLPGAKNIEQFWELLNSKRHGLRHSPPGRYEAIKATPKYIASIKEIGHDWGGYIDGPDMFDPSVFGMSPVEASMADPQHRILLEVVWEALENACEAPKSLAGTRTGVFVGLSTSDYMLFQGAFDPYGELVTPLSAPGVVHSIAANRISYLLDLRGPSMSIDTACASSSYALHQALRSLEQGECDSAIVCGANMIMSPYITKGFKRARMLAKDGIVKCFDESTDGYVRAEGAVAIVIRREEDAIAQGNRIMGVVSGSAVNHDGKTAGMFAPNADTQIELIRAAHDAARIEPDEVGFVEAHGTGTYMGDETELKALNTIFAGRRDVSASARDGGSGPCYVGSVKANVGHLEAVSGLTGLLKIVLSLERGMIPGQANLKKPMPEASVDGSRVVVPMETTPWVCDGVTRRAGVTCLGFGGANSHVVVEEAPDLLVRESSAVRSVCVLKLSAKRPEQVAQMASRLGDAIAHQSDMVLSDICYSANIGRADFEERAIIVAGSRDDLASSLAQLSEERAEEENAGQSAGSIIRGRVKRGARKVALLLSGDGVAYAGMGRALFESEPRFAGAIKACDKVLFGLAGVSVSDLLYSSRDRDVSSSALVARLTDAGEPLSLDDPALARAALFAVQYGAARLLSEIGIEPEYVVSSGVGGHVAGVLAQRLSLKEGLKTAFDGVPSGEPDKVREGLEAAFADGAGLVIEPGPLNLGADYCSELSEREIVVTSCLGAGTDNNLQFLRAVGALYTFGADIDWVAFEAPFENKRLVLPTYPFARKSFWFSDGGTMPGTIVEQNQPGVVQNQAAVAEPRSDVPADISKHAPVGSLNGSVAGGRVENNLSRPVLFEFVRDAVCAATSMLPEDITDDTCFTEVDLDSVAGLELLLRIDKKIGVMPDPEMFAEGMTFGAAIDALLELSKSVSLSRSGSQSVSDVPAVALGRNVGGGASVLVNGIVARPAHADNDTSVGLDPVAAAQALLEACKGGLDPTDYLKSIRPDFTSALHEVLLDVDFDTALGDRLSGTRFGVPVSAIDMLGGFGSTLFGHNHPALVAVLQNALTACRPSFVQMSNRTAAGALAAALVGRLSDVTGRDYKVVLGSTGAEMVDAALKHALFEWSARRDRFVSACRDEAREVPEISKMRPVMLAIEGSYHGKTLGAYCLTWHAPGRDEMGLEGPFDVVWLPRDDVSAAAEIFARYQSEVGAREGATRYNRIAGVFVEPIQGEGGMFPLSKAYVGALRRLADEAECPIIVDEIQSGMGRAGAFSAASLIDLRGDYYLFGKSLGGGLTKTSALLIDSARYAEGFGFAHTSTFGEDDHSAFVGLRALRLLDEDDLCERSRKAGDYLVAKLKDVMVRYPSVLCDVRGCGLMVGIEMTSQVDNSSQLIAGLSEQGLLGIFVASHLLHRSGIRVGTALSRPSTLRFEPSAYISNADMDATVAGVDAVCAIIEKGDAGDLVRHTAQGFRLPGQTPYRMKSPQGERDLDGGAVSAEVCSSRKRAVFLGHMINADDIGLLDKSLLSLTEAERENLAGRLVDPVLVKRVPLVSSCGETLNFEVHSLPLTSRAIIDALREGRSAQIVEQVNTAVEQFGRNGARVIGLGGLLSVITRNGLAVRNEFDGLQITTGNTYTVALAMEAVLRTASELGIDPASERVGIIGAGGNIGSTLAFVLSESFGRLRLVGREASIGRVERAADAIYDGALSALRLKGKQSATGLGAVLGELKLVSELTGMDGRGVGGNGLNGGARRSGSQINGGISEGAKLRQMILSKYGTDPFLPVCTKIEELGDCSVIVTASNAIAPILDISNVGSGVRIICDVSVPSDVDPALLVARPDIKVIRGGVAKAPDHNRFTFEMIDLPQNHLLACMTETALLGFSGKQDFEPIGDIQASGVRECHELGRKYGFALGYSSVEKPFSVEVG